MGACVSSSRTAQSGSTAANAILLSPVKETASNGNGRPPINGGVHKSQWSTPQSTAAAFRGYGSSKEDTFFDSKAWLDSDTDDDFQSVKGDFTPSQGNTPLHSFRSTPLVNNIDPPPVAVDKTTSNKTTPNSVPELSPATKKKRLSDLFKESIGNASELAAIFKNNDSESETDKTKIMDILPSPECGSSPQLSGTSSINGRSSNGGNKEKDRKLSHQSCLPSLRSCRPSVERKKKMSSAVAVGT